MSSIFISLLLRLSISLFLEDNSCCVCCSCCFRIDISPLLEDLELFHPEINGIDWPGRAGQWNQLPENIKDFIYQNRWSKLLSDKINLEETNVSRPGNSNLSASLLLKEWIKKN